MTGIVRVAAACAGVLVCWLAPAVAAAESARAISTGSYHSCIVTAGGGVQCWGRNTYGQLGNGGTADAASPVEVTGLGSGVVDVTGGESSVCAVTTAGGVACWGRNNSGQLGDGTSTDRTTPVTVSGLSSGARAVSAGYAHACAVTDAGGVKCWGSNLYGQLGDGTTVTRRTPVDVTGLSSGVIAVAAGTYHTCAVTSSGSVRCWGYNFYGQIGDGTATNRFTPVTVSGMSSGQRAVTTGYGFTCALSAVGGVKCWGDNSEGQLGDGTTVDRLSPVDVGGLASGMVWLDAGPTHACAVAGDGGAKCWGNNNRGRLGDGTVNDRVSPVVVTGLTSGTARLAGGDGHSCALTAGGGVKCWGRNDYGQVGDGTTTDRHTPVDVPGFAGDEGASAAGARRVATGDYHSCVLTAGGGVSCWGQNTYGQLGDATSTNRSMPVEVQGLSSGVSVVVAGAHHTCVLTAGGGVQCWGHNAYGQLGDGTTTNRSTAADVSGLTSGVSAISAGMYHTCAVTTTSGLKCWGFNTFGQLGDGTTTGRTTPVDVSGLTTDAAAVAAGGYHTCAITTSGGAKCWGVNSSGQLGDGTTTSRLVPVDVSGLSTGVASVSGVSVYSSCALTTAGGAKCWGNNLYGRLGDGTTTNRPTPVDVSGLTSGVSAIAGGPYHACAVLSSGALRCWGSNTYGKVGDGTTSNRTAPVGVVGLAAGVAAVATGYDHTCAITSRHGVQCWGHNSSGQLGDGTTSQRSTPGWVAGLVAGVGAMAAGLSSSCRLTEAGGVQCWGSNTDGQVGDGSTADRVTPVDVSGLASGVAAVVVGSGFACGLTTGGGIKCWGLNSAGQLGDGTTTNRSTPVDVVGMTSGVTAMAAGDSFACGLLRSGGVTCWGANSHGQLGDGTTLSRSTPAWVSGMTSGVVEVTAGSAHACARTAFGGAVCWGRNTYGQLGDGTTTSRAAPTGVSGLASGVAALAAGAGSNHTCALVTGGGVKCWGANASGQLGNGLTTNRSTPTDVSGLTSGAAAVRCGALHTCALTIGGGVRCWGSNANGQLGDGTMTDRLTPVQVSGLASGAGMLAVGWHHTGAVAAIGGMIGWGDNEFGQLGNGTKRDRLAPGAVRGFKLEDDYDGDMKADVAVYRPSTGTWFSLDSSSGNASYRSRGWGAQAQGDTPAPGDFDGDGPVDLTVFRPSTGTWFILESSTCQTTWSSFGWGTAGDTPVPADYDGDGKTDGAVYRASTGTWYIRPSSGAAQWSVVFGVSTDVPVPGHWDSDGKADIAVYRPSTGTWFVLTSSSGYTSYWYRGWGIDAQGDTPAPGDYDGDGRLDLCVFRPGTGTWFILESGSNFTTWNWFGWGGSGDTPVPTDFDGDGITDAAVYRPSTYTWYVRPSSGATQWNVVFGASGDVPLITIR